MERIQNMLDDLKKELQSHSNPDKAQTLMWFFKTGEGQYGHGDIFLGIQVPVLRKIAKKYSSLPDEDILILLRSKIHEERMIVLFIMVNRFEKGNEEVKKNIYELYLKNTRFINNWDLVDLSADRVVGAYLFDRPKDILYELARSDILWEKRIAVLSTFNFIKKGYCVETFKISKILIRDKHDLIHKAVGWMLREVGKRCSMSALEDFLKNNYRQMPRTMLRYAIERFPDELRKKYLEGKI